MYSKSILLSLIFISYFNIVNSQSNLSKQWDRRYGGTSDEGVGAMINTTDGGMVIGGWSNSEIGGLKSDSCRGSWDYWIVKIDDNGNKLWDKTFGGAARERFNSLNQTSDGGYILGGTSESGIGGDRSQPSWGMEDYWIVKTDSSGNKQWEKRFGGSKHDIMGEIELTNDGGYLLTGYSDSPISGDKTQTNWGYTDYWVVKIDSIGNFEWDRRYGGTGRDEDPWDGGVISSAKCNDGGFLIGGWSLSGIGGDKSEPAWGPNGDYWIIKIDSVGNKVWDKCYGGTEYDALHNIIPTFDGNFILGGTTFSNVGGNKTSPYCNNLGSSGGDYWVLKIDSVGNVLFDMDYGSYEADHFTSIIQTPDSGFVICGENTFANASCQKSEGYISSANAWVIKTDSLGLLEWDKSIFGPGMSNSTCLAVPIGSDCYGIVSGSSNNNIGYNTQPSYGYFDYWFLKFCDCTQPILPTASFSVSDTAFCQGKCVNFVDVSDCYNSRLWLFPGGIPSSSVQQIQAVCYPDSGYYPVTLISINSNGTDTLVKNNYIQVYPVPSQPVVIQSGDTLISSPADYYQWFDTDGSQINGETGQSFIPDSSSYYYVCVENIFGCDSCSEYLYYTLTGIKFLDGDSQAIQLGPNPTSENFTLFISDKLFAPNSFIEIYNVYGIKFLSQALTHKQTLYNSKQFPPGIYFVRITIGESSYCRKLIIENY